MLHPAGALFRFFRIDTQRLDQEFPDGFAPLDNLWVTYVKDRFVVTWTTMTDTVLGPSVRGATFDPNLILLQEPRDLTWDAWVARTQSSIALGDRFYLVWADDAEVPDAYELRAQYFTNDLVGLGEPQRLTPMLHDSLSPRMALGQGQIGVVFEQKESLLWKTYFLTVGCRYLVVD